MRDDPRAEFSFLDFERHSRTPGPAEPSKNGSTAAEGASVARLVPPSTLDPWLERNEHSEPSNEDLGIVPDRRPLVAYFLIVLALGMYVGWAFLAGWLP